MAPQACAHRRDPKPCKACQPRPQRPALFLMAVPCSMPLPRRRPLRIRLRFRAEGLPRAG